MHFKCNNVECGYTSANFFGLCKRCKNGVGEEVEDVLISNSGTPRVLSNNPKRKVNSEEGSFEACRNTPWKGLDSLLSTAGGFVEGQVVLLGSDPGVGKSTLATVLAESDTLYISSEENYKQVNSRALRVNPKGNFSIIDTTSQERILKEIREGDERLIIIDSLNSIEFGVGYQTTARYASEITQAIKETNKIGFIISQVAKSGEISGMNSIPHVVDTILHFEKDPNSHKIIATCSKNRFGEIGEVAVFQHEGEGFIEVELDTKDPIPEIGVSYAKVRFGRKDILVSIESLVAPADGSYGMVRSSGYNLNRVNQVIGILSVHGKIKFSGNDIYISISNGLQTDDIGIELAIANSLLSSKFGVEIVAEAYGELRLNGKIIGGHVDNKEINHINDLVKMYKEKTK